MTKSVSRLLAITILLLLPLGVVLPLAFAVLAWRDDVLQRVDSANQLLAKYGDQAKRVAALKEALSALEASSGSNSNLFAGTTDALASASLQTYTKQLVETGNGAIQSLQILPSKAEGALSRVGVKVQFTARSEDLQRIIYGIETGTPRLAIGAMEVRQERLSAGASGTDNQHEGGLVIQLEVSGFRRSEPAL